MKNKYDRPISDGREVAGEVGRFTNTAVPRFDGVGCWQQHLQIVQAIVKSNGWSEETATLQLFAHLGGEALNVALLMSKEKIEKWEGLSNGLPAYYNSPGRLAVFQRRFESTFRRPEMDPTMFTTELGILAARGFGDMGKRARDAMIRDKFIAGQRHCGMRRHLDSFVPDAPIGEIVDSCRVWESHSDREPISDNDQDRNYRRQSGDPRERECQWVSLQEPAISGLDSQKPVFGVGVSSRNSMEDSQLASFAGHIFTGHTTIKFGEKGPAGGREDAVGKTEEYIIGRGACVFLVWTPRTWDQPMFTSEHLLSISATGVVGECP